MAQTTRPQPIVAPQPRKGYTAQMAIEERHSRSRQMDELGRLPRNQRRGKKIARNPIYSAYPKGVKPQQPFAFSWGNIEAINASSNGIRFAHDGEIGKHESNNPWGFPTVGGWLNAPSCLFYRIARYVGGQWFPNVGGAGTMTAIVWVQIHGTTGSSRSDWVIHDIAQENRTPGEHPDETRSRLFDQLWQYREGGASVEVAISTRHSEDELVTRYQTFHGATREDAIRRVHEASWGWEGDWEILRPASSASNDEF